MFTKLGKKFDSLFLRVFILSYNILVLLLSVSVLTKSNGFVFPAS